jgi:branched-chain amino acid transport system permease protein
MTPELFFAQLLNGVQLGLLLFLMAAGLTLVFGIMSFINLAHGSLYMLGAYAAAVTHAASGSFVLALAAAAAGIFALGLLLDRVGFAVLQRRDHLDQVLATFGIVLMANEAVQMRWGSAPLFMDMPPALADPVQFLGLSYPAYRLLIIVAGLAVALGLYLLIERTRLGMLIRAGASNRQMVAALGVDIGKLNALVFALGAALAGLAGALVGPILAIQPGMGEPVLILTLVVIVIGGIGSIRGAFLGAIVVGVVDTLGRSLLPALLHRMFEPSVATALGPALASVGVYVLMAAVLALKPAGLFPVRAR